MPLVSMRTVDPFRAGEMGKKIAEQWMGRCERVLHFMGGEVKGETKIQNGSCQMGGREVTGRYKRFFLREHERSRSYRVTDQHPSLP